LTVETTTTTTTTVGWLFDNYALKDKMILWIKERNGNVKRLEHSWTPSIYVASFFKSDLKLLIQDNQILSLIKEYNFVEKYECAGDTEKREVLKLTLNDSSQIIKLSKNIEKHCKKFGQYRLYNVDILKEQSYLYEHDIFPIGMYNILKENYKKNIFTLKWILNNDNIHSFDYIIPNFRTISFDIIFSKKLSSCNNVFDAKIQSFILKIKDDEMFDKEKIEISKNDETEAILEFSSEIKKIDPDIILTSNGDQILFPHLFHRSKINNIVNELKLNLNREKPHFIQNDIGWASSSSFSSSSSSSFISYGRTYFRPKAFHLYGRIHIDIETSFIYKETGIEGLSEISRICRIPLQIASRSTIGKCLSSLYFYNAEKKDILIPWKPTTSEVFKTFTDLLNADRGGFVFESKPGIYEKVEELDFVSLYPNIMLKKNISSETIICDCCHADSDNRVPGLEHLYYICKKKTGIVPSSLKTILERRLEYKNRKNNITLNNKFKNCYNKRQAALKWILVTSFGYLGFNNSKFGRIDAHIAVCAFARDILLQTSKITESHGFDIIHGIVDSIWIKKRDNEKKNDDYKDAHDCLNLKKDIENKTGFQISFEGVYKWIVFDSSKKNQELPALNRYFGVFEDNTIKSRGIEARRHDTPPLFIKFQNELLQTIAKANSIKEIVRMHPILKNIYNKYQYAIFSRKVSYMDLIFTKRITKDSVNYSNRKTIESCVIQLLINEGNLKHAGEEIKYIITDFYSKTHLDRAMPIELIEESHINYDIKRYCKLLDNTYNSIIKYFK
jgi:DNA polymerase, archaea type